MNSRFFQLRMSISALIFFIIYTIPAWILYYYDIFNITYVGGYHLFVIGFLIAQYYGGVKYSLRAVGAEELNDEYYQQRAAEIADQMGVPKPKLMIGYFGILNAFAVGRRGNGYVVLSESMLQTLEPEEVDGVIAHEIAHLNTRDTVVMLLGESLDYVIFSAKWKAAHSANGVFSMIGSFIVAVLGVIIRGIILIPLRLISRKREYIADKQAAYYTGNPEALAVALEKIGYYNSNIDEYPLQAAEVHELCIFNEGFSVIERVLGTHPPSEKRIEKLRQMDDL